MNAPEKKPQPRWARRKDARPEEIIAAALDLFVERGFATTRLDDVAARAGVSKGTLYLYFENKEDLFKAVVRGNVLPVLQHGEDLLEKFSGSSADLVRQLVRGWWELTGSTKIAGIPKLIIAEAGNFPDLAEFYYQEVILRAHSMFRRVLQRGMKRAIPRGRRRQPGARGAGTAGDACSMESFVRLLRAGTVAAAALYRQLSGYVIAQPAQAADEGERTCPRQKLAAFGCWRPALPPQLSPPFPSNTRTASPRPSPRARR